jgi:hypothetical protein
MEKVKRAEDIAQHELQRKVPATDQGKQTVDGRDEGQNREHIGEDMHHIHDLA